MPARHAAQLYTSHFWHSGVLASSALSCRAATAAAVIALSPPSLSTADRTRLQRLASSPPVTTRSAPLLQGLRDLTPNRINLATVIDPSTGQQVVYAPPKKHHQLGSATAMYQLLHRSAISWCDDSCNVGNQPDSAWSHWRQKNCCSAALCPNADDNVHETGFVLPTGHLLCPSCFTDWEAEILTQLNITSSQPCSKDAKGSCSGCTLATAPSRTRLRHLLVRGHLRDLCYHFLQHLPPNTMNQMVCILQRELCDLHTALDRKYMLGVPSRIYTSVLGWLAWNYSTLLSQPITSMPPLDVGQSEQWATVCYNKLCAVDLRPVTRKAKRPQRELMLAHVYDQAPALQNLEPTLTDHSGLSGVLLSNMAGRRLLRQALDLDARSLPAPADNSIGRHNDARCAICKNVDNDAWDAADPGLVCHNCLACKQWWHLECLPEEEKETTELADPIGRCATCIADNCYALNRILELARLESGQYHLLLEYIGYNFYELEKPSALAVMERVGREALVEAYQRHEITKGTRSLLLCVQALIDALDLGEPLKTFGLHCKMTHDDPRLYLIGHASLEKRGLSIGQANIYQMLAPEHRLYLPFSLSQLLVDVNGKALPKPPNISARPLTLQELVDHLTALTTNSLPLALAHITLHSGSDQGLGLLSGSRLSDIITALAVFGTRYDKERWLTFLRQAVPGCTELEAQWLVSHPSPVDSPLSAPQSHNKRKASHSGGSASRRMKSSAAGPNPTIRRSPRSHHTPMPAPAVIPDTEAPSTLAASHQSHRPQLSQAFRRLYGTAQHKGILAGLAILKLYCECLGTTWTGNPDRDPVVFFRTSDMADTSRWQRLPAEFDKDQAKAYSFTRPDHSTNRISDRSSGLGPVNGRPP